MIFDADDMEVLTRTINRKMIEATALAEAAMSASLKVSIINQLTRDIFRCRMMMELGSGELNSLSNNIDALRNNLEVVDNHTCLEYMSRLSSEELKDEQKFMWLYNILLAYIPNLTAALNGAGRLISGERIVPEEQVQSAIRTKALMQRLMTKTDACSDFLSFCAEECSLVLRISSGKEIDAETMLGHVERSRTMDASGFNEACPRLMDSADIQIWNAFNSGWKERLQIILARAICDQVFGAPAAASRF